MTRRTVAWSLIIVAFCMTSGCAARFSPDKIRNEIERQRGQDPLSVFELNLGRFSTLLLKKALATENGELPLSGLDQIQLAVFEVVGAGRSRVVYGRLQGTLSPDLPAAVGDALKEGGPEEVKRIFMELGEEAP